jgi:hypothetical protein
VDTPGTAQAEDLDFLLPVNRGKQKLFRPNPWPPAALIQVAGGYWISLRRAEAERRAYRGYSMG